MDIMQSTTNGNGGSKRAMVSGDVSMVATLRPSRVTVLGSLLSASVLVFDWTRGDPSPKILANYEMAGKNATCEH